MLFEPLISDRRLFLLVVALLQIAVSTEHLAVIGRCVTALRPRDDVICLHILKLKRLAANGALVTLLLIGRLCVSCVEAPNAKQPLFTR